jgi:hypothetical protein
MNGLIRLIIINCIAILVIGTGNQFSKAKVEACKGRMQDFKHECLQAPDQVQNGQIGFALSTFGYIVFVIGFGLYFYNLIPAVDEVKKPLNNGKLVQKTDDGDDFEENKNV